ncbi:nucleotidyltransferase family protein [Thalassotalea ganghwensis]
MAINQKSVLQSDEKIKANTFAELSFWLSKENLDKSPRLAELTQEKNYLPLIALANNFWLTGALIAQFKSDKLWQYLPEQLHEYLTYIEQIYQQRALAIKQEVIDVCELLSQHGIAHLLLKGAAQLFNGVATPITSRYMVDIDILIPLNQLAQAINVLKAQGYQERTERFDVLPLNHHHAPPLIRPNGACYIELHVDGLKHQVNEVLSTAAMWQECQELSLDNGLESKQLSANHQVIMAIAHSEISDQHYQHNTLDLRQVYNVYRMVKYYDTAIDWQIVNRAFSLSNQTPALTNFLYQLGYFFDTEIPIALENKQLAEQFIERGITKYVKTQGRMTAMHYFQALLRSYDGQNLLRLYGKVGLFPVIRARFLHLRRHLMMLWSQITGK